ncbi:thioesterase-like superfamily-domain-containing protein [Aspergillus navahoensis]
MASRPTRSLLEATSALPLENGSPDRFMARNSSDWCTQQYTQPSLATPSTEAIVKYPDPIHIDLALLRESEPGHGETQQSPACIAIATFANLDKERGLTQDRTPSKPVGAHPFPSRETECVTIDDPVVGATPVTRKLPWVAPRSADGLWGHRLGGHQREVWLSFRDGSPISDLLHLALLADTPLQPPATHTAGFYARHALSTLCLSVEFKTRPGLDTKWVLVRSNSHRFVDGRYDVNIQILDEDGEIPALSNQVVYISDLRTNLEMTKTAKM